MDSAKKLVTHKGLTVTKGYLEGTMDFQDTVLYLSKLGIHGLFEEVVRKAVFVPPGFQAQHQKSQRTYQQGDFIPVPEHDWDSFVQAAQSERNENWIISEVPVMQQPSEVDTQEVTSEDYQASLDKLLDKYDENELGKVFNYLMAQAESIEDVNMREQQKNAIHELATDIDTRMKLAEEIASNKKLKLADVIDARELINEFRVNSDIKHIPAKGKLSLTIGKGELHLGAFIATMEISGNVPVLNQLKDELSKIPAGQELKGKIDIDTKAIFPNGLKDAKEIAAYRDMLDLLRFDLDDDALIMGISRVTSSLADIYNKKKIISTPHEVISAMRELHSSIDNTLNYLEDVKGADALHQSIYDAINTTQFKVAVSETRRSIDSGNLLVQSMMDFSLAVSGRLTDSVVNLMDETFDFQSSLGETLKERLGSHINVGEIPADIRKSIKEDLYRNPLQLVSDFKAGVPTGKLNRMITSVREAFGGATVLQQGGLGGSAAKMSHVTDAITNEVLLAKDSPITIGNNTFANPIEAVKHIAASYKVSDTDTFVKVFTAEAVNNLRSNVNANIQLAQCRDILLSSLDVYSAMTGETLEKPDAKMRHNFEPIRLATSATLSLFNKQLQRGRSQFVSKEKGISTSHEAAPTTSSKLRQDAIEGISALYFHTLLKNNTVPGDNIDYDARKRAATAATYFCGAGGIEVDPEHGAFVNTSPDGTTYLNMRVLSLARFLPPMSRDGYKWAPDVQKDMDTEIAVKKGKGLEEITDIDRLEHFASSETPVKPIHALGENIRAGLGNVTRGNTNIPGINPKENILSSDQVRRLSSLIDYDTDVGRQSQRIGKIHQTVKDYMGTTKATDADIEKLNSGEINPADYSTISLANLLDRSFHDANGKKLTIPASEAYSENAAKIAVDRASRVLGDNISPQAKEAFLAYLGDKVKGAFETVKQSGSHLGYDGEALLNLSVPMSFMGTAKNIEVLEPQVVNEEGGKEQHTWNAFKGLKWTDANNSTHYFGSLNGTTNGAIDDVHIEHKKDGTVILSGIESKMEAGEPPIPHTGNATHATRLLANYYTAHEDNINKVIFNDNTMLSASYNTPDSDTFAGGYSYTRRGKGFVAAGIGFGEGNFSKKGEAR